jgi:phosphoglycolate phosphatase
MIKAVIFDYDDTLVKTIDSKWDALRETGKRFHNLEIKNSHIKKFWGLPYQEMLTGVLMKADSFENLNKSYESVRSEFPMKAYSDAVETINKLLEKYKVGILTASARKLVIEDLEMLEFPIDKFFYIQTSEDTVAHKPDPKVFEPIIQKLKTENITKNEVVYIGDSLRDYFAARDANIEFFGITHGSVKSKKEFEKEGAKTINNFIELQNLLK